MFSTPSSVPLDGGYGWVIVFCSFINNCLIASHFGCFSLLYPAITTSFESQYGISGWIGSFSQAMVYLPAFLYSKAVSRYGCKLTSVVGSCIVFVGYVSSSFCTSIPQLYLTYGLVAGTGIGIMYLPSILVVQQAFTSKRVLASGLSLSGIAIGVVVLAPVMQYLINTYTWRGAMLIHGSICLHGVACGLLFHTNSHVRYRRLENREDHINNSANCEGSQNVNKSEVGNKNYSTFSNEDKGFGHQMSGQSHSYESSNRQHQKDTGNDSEIESTIWDIFDFSILKNSQFLLYGVGTFAMNVGMNTFIMHTPSRALKYGVDPKLVGILPTVIAIGNISSRLIFSFVSNLTCTNRTLQYGVGISGAGIVIMCSTLSQTFIPIVFCCVLVGFCNGTSLTIQPTVLVDLFTLENLAKTQAILNLFIGMAALLTTPFAGFLFDTTNNYNIPFLVNGGVELLGSSLIMVTVCLQIRHNVQKT